jgi:hypothetical protein
MSNGMKLKKCNRTCVWQYSVALGFGDLISRPPNKIGFFFFGGVDGRCTSSHEASGGV